MTDRDLKKIREEIRSAISEILPEIIKSFFNRKIGSREAAQIMGYKTTGMIVRHAEFFGGYRESENGDWVFDEAYIRELKRTGAKPSLKVKCPF